jgi:hypothetical protein
MPSGRFDQLTGAELTARSSDVTAHTGFRQASHPPRGNGEVAK